MKDERILIFLNYHTLNYWFKYIVNFLKDNNIKCKVYRFDKEIIINNIKLVFIPEYNRIRTIMFRHTSKIFGDLEESLEKDFIETLKEILSNK